MKLGYKGISLNKRLNKFESYVDIKIHNKRHKIHVGYSSTLKEAVQDRESFIDNLK
jgi:hypothetical protein